MGEKIKISVIIPVYNAEKYLRQCLNSVISQTLQEIEIICVNDASTDGSLAILREYEAKDARVRVLTQEKQGAGIARNSGMAAAQGAYLMFWDADDFFEEQTLQEMLHRCEDTHADICLCGASRYDTESDKYAPMPWMLRDVAVQEPFNRRTVSDILGITSPAPWNKLFSADFVRKHKLQFQGLQRINDVYFVLSALALADKVVTVRREFIHYRVGQTTNLQSALYETPLLICEALAAVKEKLEDAGVWKAVEWSYLNAVLSNLRYNLKGMESQSSARERLLQAIEEKYWVSLGLAEHPYLFYKEPDLYVQISAEVAAYKKQCDSDRPKLSVILPVYNVEEYLEECLDSVLCQTLKDIEIICVDDGSTDSSRNILQKYAEKDKRIRLILKDHNEGLLLARKAGAMRACAEYLIFVDSDDYISRNACEQMVSLTERYRTDVIQVTADVATLEEKTDKSKVEWLRTVLRPVPTELQGEQILDDFFIKRRHVTSLWGKAFRTELCQRAYAKADCDCYVGEDIFFFFFFAVWSHSFTAVCTEPLYIYRYGAGISNDEKMQLPKFEAYCRMAELPELARRFIAQEHCIDRCAHYCDAMADRMMTDCCRIYKNRLNEEDRPAGGEVLLRYWRDDSVAEQVIVRELGVSLEEFERTTRPVPVYTKTGTAYAKVDAAPKVSVIVPVYNTEQYLSECLDSILGQTLREIQIICVNDGSFDNSLKILEEYADRDDRITIISQRNTGQSAARNAALDIAIGRYVYMLDSDDYLDADALNDLYARCERDDLDVLMFDAQCAYDDAALKAAFTPSYSRKGYAGVYTGVELMSQMRDDHQYVCSACLAIYRRDLLEQNHISFLDGIIHEDELFSFHVMMNAQRVSHVGKKYYHRRIRRGSTMTSPKTFKNVFGYFSCMEQILCYGLSQDWPESKQKAIWRSFSAMLGSTKNIYGKLSSGEKQKAASLDPLSRLLFDKLVLSNGGTASLSASNEAALIRSSMSYRIGRSITFVPRKIRGGGDAIASTVCGTHGTVCCFTSASRNDRPQPVLKHRNTRKRTEEIITGGRKL